MTQILQSQCDGNNHKQNLENSDNETLDNILRVLTMLEKAIDRFIRQAYFNQNQYPEIITEIEDGLNTIRCWIQGYKLFADFPSFSMMLGLSINELGQMIVQLMGICKPVAGKKQVKKSKLASVHPETENFQVTEVLENVNC